MWISILGVCISVVYANRYLVLVLVSDMDFDIGYWCECVVWILIFGVCSICRICKSILGVGVIVAYGYRYLMYVLGVIC